MDVILTKFPGCTPETLFSAICIKSLITVGLDFAMIAGGALVKLPLILNILNAKSAQGLSFSSLITETIVFVVSLAYNIDNDIPFGMYGETYFLLLQNVVILLLFFHFQAQLNSKAFSIIASIFLSFGVLVSGQVPSQYLALLQSASVVLNVYSKIPQILANIKNGSTFPLSLVSVLLQFGGSTLRFVGAVTRTSDIILMISTGLPALLNGVLFVQMLIYPNKPKTTKTE